MFANSKDGNGEWIWQSALNADGLIANQVVASALHGLTVNALNMIGGTITGATITGGKIIAGDDSSKIYVMLDSQGNPFGIYFRDDSDGGKYKSLVDLWANNDGGFLRIRNTEEYAGGLYRPIYTLGGDGNGGVAIHSRGDCHWYVTANSKMFVDFARIDFAAERIGLNGKLVVGGDFSAGGTKNALVKTEHFGKRLLYCDESDKVYFSTKGLANTELASGEYKYILRLDDIFTETIEPNSVCPYIVTATAYSNAHIWIDSIYDKYIIFKSDKPCKFAYVLQATRKGYAEEYLKEVE
jgi:hypothetical protein